ncbi:MAG: hypothetical protein FJ271_17505 [Planctomycetes bacterium]|nr:hypothetical protein [Planctomycetota bacterium]
MNPCMRLAVVACLFGISCGSAEAGPWIFRWQKGQSLTYRVQHDTKVTDVLPGSRLVMASRLSLVKRWEIDTVDDQGTATIRLKVIAMRNEQLRPNAEPLVFDSENPDKSTPELHAQMSKFIGKVLAVLRVDAQGNVVKTLEGSATQFASDLPFLIRLPFAEPKEGQGWERPADFTLAPPFGTGEKYQAVQQCQVTKLNNGQAQLQVSTTIKNMPQSPSAQLPLVQKQSAGEVAFDVAAGRIVRADLRVDREIMGHQGPGSSYRFESRYTEHFVD